MTQAWNRRNQWQATCTGAAVPGDVAEDCQSLVDIIRAQLTVLHGKVPVVEEVRALDDPERAADQRLRHRAEGLDGSGAGDSQGRRGATESFAMIRFRMGADRGRRLT